MALQPGESDTAKSAVELGETFVGLFGRGKKAGDAMPRCETAKNDVPLENRHNPDSEDRDLDSNEGEEGDIL